LSRYPQEPAKRGSQKWIQAAVNQHSPRYLDDLISKESKDVPEIIWSSPLAGDDYAEYRDEAFLNKIGQNALKSRLPDFWPSLGPQWDALGTRNGDVFLVEAKAHIGEIFSPPSGAGETSMKTIKQSLSETADLLGAKPRSPWETIFYQLTNRLAHLHFLRKNGIKAWLVLVNFIGDRDVGGPMTQAEWLSAYRVVWHVLGVSENASPKVCN
jgi:hypothetical protein